MRLSLVKKDETTLSCKGEDDTTPQMKVIETQEEPDKLPRRSKSTRSRVLESQKSVDQISDLDPKSINKSVNQTPQSVDKNSDLNLKAYQAPQTIDKNSDLDLSIEKNSALDLKAYQAPQSINKNSDLDPQCMTKVVYQAPQSID